MNKTLIVFLAVAILSVHAFVKRDAPAGDASAAKYLEDIQKRFETLSKDVQENINKALNPEDIKKNFNEFVDSMSKAINDLKPKEAAPK